MTRPAPRSNVQRFESRAINVNKMSKWSKRIQVFTWFTVGFTGFYMVLFNDYGNVTDKHVFSDIQRWAQNQKRALLGDPKDPGVQHEATRDMYKVEERRKPQAN